MTPSAETTSKKKGKGKKTAKKKDRGESWHPARPPARPPACALHPPTRTHTICVSRSKRGAVPGMPRLAVHVEGVQPPPAYACRSLRLTPRCLGGITPANEEQKEKLVAQVIANAFSRVATKHCAAARSMQFWREVCQRFVRVDARAADAVRLPCCALAFPLFCFSQLGQHTFHLQSLETCLRALDNHALEARCRPTPNKRVKT